MLTHQEREEHRARGIVSAFICLALAVFLFGVLTWIGRFLLVTIMGQDEVTWWVTLIVAGIIWLFEELLQLTFPCRRVLRRFASWLANKWLATRSQGQRVKSSGGAKDPVVNRGTRPEDSPLARVASRTKEGT
jgi:hypothetical protein